MNHKETSLNVEVARLCGTNAAVVASKLWESQADSEAVRYIDGYPWIAMKFRNDEYVQMPVWQVGLLTKMQYKDDFFGEKNNALLPTMRLIDIQHQGITEGIKHAASIRFVAQMSNFAKIEDLSKQSKLYAESNLNKDSGGTLEKVFCLVVNKHIFYLIE